MRLRHGALVATMIFASLSLASCTRSPMTPSAKGDAQAAPAIDKPSSSSARNVRLDLPIKFENETFVRYALGDDEVVQRRGAEARGAPYGLEVAKRNVTKDGETLLLVTYRAILSPPPQVPGNHRPPPPETYRPEHDVLYVFGSELLFAHREGAASLVDRVLASVRW